MTPESVQAMIDQALLRNSTNRGGSHSSDGENQRPMQTAPLCFYTDFMKCQPLNFKGTEGVVGLTRWIKKMESVFNISGCAIENQVKFSTCTLLGDALTWWNVLYERQTAHRESSCMHHRSQIPAYQTQLQLQGTLIQTQHQVHETRSQMQQTEMADAYHSEPL
ncbi:hypothetical protein Tco_1162924 [Tanacetum coccineum]